MPSHVLYYERQTIRQKWLWIILGLVTLYLMYGSFTDLFLHDTDAPPMMTTSFLILLGVDVLLWLMKLEFMIKEEGFYFRFRPFTIRYKKVMWEELSDIFVRTYKPIREYGGWGLRTSFQGHGMALTISGNRGIQLIFKTGRKILIGTKNAEKVEAILSSLKLPKH